MTQKKISCGDTVVLFNPEKSMKYRLLITREEKSQSGTCSVGSAAGRMLVGKKAGDEIQIDASAGRSNFLILEVIPSGSAYYQ